MGRIADALKKAEGERNEKLRMGLAGDSSAQADRPAIVPESAPDRTRLVSKAIADDAARGCEKGFSHQRGQRGHTVERTDRFLTGAALIGAAGPMAPSPPWDAHPGLVALHERSSSITEQYRAVRTWLLSRNTKGEHGCIAVTSSVPREGKSVTTANLAVVMAEVRHMNVLVVDSDFRQGSLAKLFRMPNSPGLADVLAGRARLADAIATTPLGNLSFLPAGTCQGLSPTELLNSTPAARIFDEIRERYQYILVDTPPVQRLSDVGVIGALCSGIVMVVRMHKTASTLVRQSLHWLQSNNLNVIGCVAAACSLKAARYAYKDYE